MNMKNYNMINNFDNGEGKNIQINQNANANQNFNPEEAFGQSDKDFNNQMNFKLLNNLNKGNDNYGFFDQNPNKIIHNGDD